MRRMEAFERFSPVPRRIDLPDGPVTIWKPPDIESLIDLEAFERDERIPYWADVWESAIVLAEELAVLDGAGRRLLELGCGLGLPAILAARRGFRVTATDYEQPALEGLAYTARQNGIDCPETRVVDWRNPPHDLGRYDLVVAADVLYERHHPAALAAVLAGSLEPDGEGIVADPCRQVAGAFPSACHAAGLEVDTTPARRPHGRTDGPEICLYRVRLAGAAGRRPGPVRRRA
jgi:SAM-dependent methyltransferase